MGEPPLTSKTECGRSEEDAISSFNRVLSISAPGRDEASRFFVGHADAIFTGIAYFVRRDRRYLNMLAAPLVRGTHCNRLSSDGRYKSRDEGGSDEG
jgi:hypothetical protein